MDMLGFAAKCKALWKGIVITYFDFVFGITYIIYNALNKATKPETKLSVFKMFLITRFLPT